MPRNDFLRKVHIHCYNRYINEKISNLAYRDEGKSLWNFHILPIIDHVKYLCDIYSVDPFPIILGAYFHDITRLDGDDENHHISSAIYAKNYLKESKIDDNVIKIVHDMIRDHRGSIRISRDSIESAILASADGFALISNIHLLFFSAYKKNNLGLVNGVSKVIRKINNSKSKLLPESLELVEKHYGGLIRQIEKYI